MATIGVIVVGFGGKKCYMIEVERDDMKEDFICLN